MPVKRILGTWALIAAFVLPLHAAQKIGGGKEKKVLTAVPSKTKNPGQIRVESVTRSVDVQRAQSMDWSRAGKDSVLNPADQIRTGRRSVARMKLADGSKVMLLQNSTARMETL